MNNEELEVLREEYMSLFNLKKSILELESKKEKLDKESEEYLSIVKNLSSLKNNLFYDISNLSDREMLSKAISRVRISDSNNIYVYMGTFRENNCTDIEHGVSDYKVSFNDSNADYREYRDLELDDYEFSAIKKVPMNECLKFEEDNTVLYLTDTFNDKYFYKVRDEYFRNSLDYGQDFALEKVLCKKH